MSGLGFALMNTSRLLGGALGLAILAITAAARTLGDVGLSPAHAQTDGFSRSLAISAAVCAAGAILAIVLARSDRSAAAHEPWRRTTHRRAMMRLSRRLVTCPLVDHQ